MTARLRVAARAAGVAVLCIALLLGACAAMPGPAPRPRPPYPTQPLLSAEHWRALYDDDARAGTAGNDRLSRSGDSNDYYTLAYAIDAQASMYEATGDPAYASQALRWVHNMTAAARPSATLPASSFRDGYLGWASPSNHGNETPLYESYAWRYVTRLLRLLHANTSTLPADVREAYVAVLTFTEVHIVDKWIARGADDHIYRSRTHMAAHWASIALDVSRLTVDPVRRAACAQIVRNIDDHLPNYPSSLRRQMHPAHGDPEAYWWSDVWGSSKRPGQDIAHGSGVISYVLEARELDAGWSQEDLTRFGRTLTAFALAPRGPFPEYVDGTGQGEGWLADGWVKLGRYDPATQAALQSYPVQNGQFYSAMAVNARILAARDQLPR